VKLAGCKEDGRSHPWEGEDEAQSAPIGIANRKMALFRNKTLWHTSTLKMEKAHSSKRSISAYMIMWCHNQEEHI
jgi:hypothetical protein